MHLFIPSMQYGKKKKKEIVDKSTQTTESTLTPTHFPLNMFIVLHALRPPVRPRCSKPPIYFVSLLNQQISLFLHSMFSLRGTSQTAKADHICDPLCALHLATHFPRVCVRMLLLSASFRSARGILSGRPSAFWKRSVSIVLL